MTRVYITIDTEYSSGLVSDLGPQDRADNYARSIACLAPDGPAGVPHKLRVLEETGQKAVFFVDPMPALVWGVTAIEDIIVPILDAGQEVQLHLHTEWLALAGDRNPLSSKRTGVNLFDFPLEEQCELINYAGAQLVAAGAPQPVAFRAGNYGANDDTLRALDQVGIAYDTSHCPALTGTASRITLGSDDRDPLSHEGVIEVPVGSIGQLGSGQQRHAQITALSLAEMRAALLHARDIGRESFTLVSHSFELFNRRKRTANPIVRHRFDGLCEWLRDTPGITTGTYRDHPPQVMAQTHSPELLPASAWRTGWRYAEQALSNTLYGAT